MNWINLLSLILGSLFCLAAFFLFATIALFFFADREADRVKKLKQQQNETPPT